MEIRTQWIRKILNSLAIRTREENVIELNFNSPTLAKWKTLW